MTNKFIGVGRLTKDAELRYTNSNKAVANFTVACDSGYGDNKQTEFVNCVAWEKKAESVSKYCSKGSLVYIEGRLKTDKYQAQDGTNRYKTEVVVNDIKFLESKGNQEQPNKQSDPFESASAIEVTEDSLPF